MIVAKQSSASFKVFKGGNHMLSDFFKNKTDHIYVNQFDINLYSKEPDEVINDYFELICNVQNETQLYNLLSEFFEVAYGMGVQDVLYEEMLDKVGKLQAFINGGD